MSKIAAFSATLFLFAIPAQAAIYTIQPDETASKDAIAYEAFPTTPLESAFSNILGIADTPTGHSVMTFLQFDLSSLAGVSATQVGSATLKLQAQTNTLGGANPSPAFPVTANLYSATSAWNEATIAWNSRPAAGALYDSELIDSSSELVEFDVTALVKGWLDNSITNFGVRLEQDAEVFNGSQRVGAAFVSASGGASARPLLEINAVPEPGSATLVLAAAIALAAFRRRFAA